MNKTLAYWRALRSTHGMSALEAWRCIKQIQKENPGLVEDLPGIRAGMLRTISLRQQRQKLVVAFRPKTSPHWTHHFRVIPSRAAWRDFYRQARLYRKTHQYAVLRDGQYHELLR